MNIDNSYQRTRIKKNKTIKTTKTKTKQKMVLYRD